MHLQEAHQNPHQACVAERKNCGWMVNFRTRHNCKLQSHSCITQISPVTLFLMDGVILPTKMCSPRKVIEVNIRKDKEAWAPFDPRKGGEQDISESNETRFLNGLLKSMESCLYSQRRNKLYMTRCTECRLV